VPPLARFDLKTVLDTFKSLGPNFTVDQSAKHRVRPWQTLPRHRDRLGGASMSSAFEKSSLAKVRLECVPAGGFPLAAVCSGLAFPPCDVLSSRYEQRIALEFPVRRRRRAPCSKADRSFDGLLHVWGVMTKDWALAKLQSLR